MSDLIQSTGFQKFFCRLFCIGRRSDLHSSVTGFAFFLLQEDGKAEENMAQKRAALLEKRMRREKESQQKKMQLEAELEQKKEEAR